jgi:hypothetical protein
MVENKLSTIFHSLKSSYDKDMAIHEIISGISYESVELCHPTFSTKMNQVIKVFKKVNVDNLISMHIYKNPSFSSKLIVSISGKESPWLTLKESSIKSSGLGVFASRPFKKNEFVTVYLGVIDKEPSVNTYVFQSINGAPYISKSSIMEDYWFGH